MSARHSFGVEAEQMRPEQAEIARLTAENERLDAEVHALKCYLGDARARNHVLAKRVEALRHALQGMHDGIGGADHATQHAAAALAADDKAAQS